MTCDYLNAAGVVVDSLVVTGPGAIEIPALAQTHRPSDAHCVVITQRPPPEA